MAHKISIIDAAHQGRVEEVRVLMQGHTEEHNSAALRWAAVGGHIECVTLLIPVSNLKDDNSLPLQWACQNNDQACFDLCDVSDPQAALNYLQTRAGPGQDLRLLRERIEVQRQKNVLDNAVCSTQRPNVVRKM